jgi:hypothetical protein
MAKSSSCFPGRSWNMCTPSADFMAQRPWRSWAAESHLLFPSCGLTIGYLPNHLTFLNSIDPGIKAQCLSAPTQEHRKKKWGNVEKGWPYQSRAQCHPRSGAKLLLTSWTDGASENWKMIGWKQKARREDARSLNPYRKEETPAFVWENKKERSS